MKDAVLDIVINGQPLFATDKRVAVARAPGRLDVMGGIADYSGSLVLQMPIQESTYAFVQETEDGNITAVSLPVGDQDGLRVFTLDASFVADNLQRDNRFWREYFRSRDAVWASYILGCLILLLKVHRRKTTGMKILIVSEVPEGKGVSSSAALEISTMLAVSNALGLEVDRQVLAVMARDVENHIAGAPCGIMDQMAVMFGQERKLMALLCQPAELQEYVSIPDSLSVWGIDSGIRHAVSGSDYHDVRVGAFMGFRILSDQPRVDAGGYLANISPEMFQAHSVMIPDAILGSEYLSLYGPLEDVVSSVDSNTVYAVRTPTAHPIFEHARIQEWKDLLTENAALDVARLGEIMYESHASYSSCGLGSDGTDLLVSLVKNKKPDGLIGARISGGGSGGTVVVLGASGADTAIEKVCHEYEQATGYKPHIFSGSSSGAEVLV